MITTSGRLELDSLQRSVSIAGLGHDLHAAGVLEDADEPAADQLVVVAQHHPDQRFSRHVCTLAACRSH